ncbi:MAG: pirin family protein [Xanthomonadales bacterium]|nr:pirin family protein [Gammaproteobacteria bacterium]NNK04877.1 pirin family protein [Xanthomonadales bacterium]
MLKIRNAHERGHFKNNWLDSYHTFSFGEYYDPNHMGVSVLRVINDDKVIPGAGFPTHPHKNMEIVSYVLDGALEHKDSMGNGSVIRPGDVQRMSAGTGVTHSEFNPSDENPVNFLQIWLLPNAQYTQPGYEQKHFPAPDRQGELKLLVSGDGRDGSVSANTDALMYGALLDEGQSLSHDIKPDRVLYVHVARGGVEVNGQALNRGDGCQVSAEPQLEITGRATAEVLLFDLPLTS